MPRSNPPVAKGPEKRITRGGIKLRAYIERHCDGIKAEFARRAGLDRLAVFRVVSGTRRQDVSVDFALAVERETKGRIRAEDFLSSTVNESPAAVA